MSHMRRGLRICICATLVSLSVACQSKKSNSDEHGARTAATSTADASKPKPEPGSKPSSNTVDVTNDKSMDKSQDTSSPAPLGAISFKDVAKPVPPGFGGPLAFRFTEAGTHLTYLASESDSLTKEMYALNLADQKTKKIASAPGGGATEENLPPEEKLRRERARMHSLGIPSYRRARETDLYVFSLVGDIWIKQGLEGELVQVVSKKDGTALDARPSADGKQIAFVRGGELFVVESKAGAKARQVSSGPTGEGISRGVAEFVAQEEMGRSEGYWWAPEGTALAYAQVDESHIPEFRIMHSGSDSFGADAQEDHRYPFAGQPNAKVSLFVVSSAGGKPREVKLPVDGWNGDYYLARVDWEPGGTLLVQVQNREQTELRLARVDAKTGNSTVLLTETSDIWVNLHSFLRPLTAKAGERAGSFIWASERDGFRHLYLYDRDAKKALPLTAGEWMVDDLVAVDEAGGKVYFTSTKDDPTQRHLYVVGLDGTGMRQITQAPGMHNVTIDPTFTHYVDAHSNLQQPPLTVVRKLADNSQVAVLHDGSKDESIARLDLAAPQVVKVTAHDGETLYAMVYRPDEAKFGPGPYPTMVSVYGGPHVQRVQQTWGSTAGMREQMLRQNGYLVIKLDNRGSSGRGLKFEGKIKHDAGNIEVKDQVDGVRWAVAEGLADEKRVGIMGWSYGGYMSAISLVKAPETFKVGIAGAPVTHWDGYDSHYTERYMGLPQKNAEGYERSSVMKHVSALRGKLLLVHGLLDENVHFRHTARLIKALISANKDYDVLLFPDARHGPRQENDRIYLERRIFEYLRKNL